MADRIRFHLDENVDPDIGYGLRRYGEDVTTTVESGLRTKSDLIQLDFVRAERRTLVTHDVDFLRLASQSRNHPGIVYCDKLSLSIGEIIRGLILIYEVLTAEDMAGQVEYL